MKKKLLTILPIFLLSLSGCSSTNPAPHSHQYDLENVDWFWQETSTGYKASATFTCPECKEDVEGHEVKIDATVTSRTEKNPTCQEDGILRYTAKVTFEEQEFTSSRDKTIHDENAHHYTQVIDDTYLKSPATCEQNAVYYYSCEFCHHISEETFEKENSKLAHTLSHVAEKEATCSEAGNIEYWTCDNCHKYFSDADGVTEITEQETIIAPNNNHTLTHHEASSSTCQEHGNIEYWTCDNCHKYFSDADGTTEISESEIELPLSHDMTYHEGTPASCFSDGEKDYYTCSYEPGVLYKDEDGTEKYNNEDELIIPQLEHEFNADLECIHCQKSMSEIYELEETNYLERVSPISTTNIGMTKETVILAATDHVFKEYNFDNKKAIDLWLEYDYTLQTSDSYFLIYLFNQTDEAGAVLRLQTNRKEDDGIVPAYIYTMNAYGEESTIVQTPGSAGTFFYFPRKCGVKSTTENVIHITANCINPTNNLYELSFMLGVKGQELYYPSTNAEALNNQKVTFNIELGADYFNNNTHNLIRFTSIKDAEVTLKDAKPQDSTPLVTYLTENGDAIGKSTSSTLVLPTLKEEDRTLLGWFDLNGNKVADGQEVTSKLVIRPIFTDTKDNMFTLNDFGVERSTYNKNCREQLSKHGVYTTSGNEYDVYFTYQLESMDAIDNYFIFGFPYDAVDEANRIAVRIDNSFNSKDRRICGYIYGCSLGKAGDSGTRFDSPERNRDNPYSPLLIHFTVHDNGDNTIKLTVEILDLESLTSYTVFRDITFSGFTREPLGYGIKQKHISRNMFAIQNAINCSATIDSVF